MKRIEDMDVDERELRLELGRRHTRIANLEAELAQERRCRAADMAMMTVKMKKLQAVADAAREIDEILSDREARKEIDSFTGQTLHCALAQLEYRGGQAAPIFDAWANEVERLRAVADAARKVVDRWEAPRYGTGQTTFHDAFVEMRDALAALDEETHHG